jgi:hypothetical protein
LGGQLVALAAGLTLGATMDDAALRVTSNLEGYEDFR